jgi:excisionase family DNA binding protein
MAQPTPTLEQSVRDLHTAGYSQRSIAHDLRIGCRKMKQIVDSDAAWDKDQGPLQQCGRGSSSCLSRISVWIVYLTSPAKELAVMVNEIPLSDVRFLTVAEVATIMRVSKMTVYRLVQSGELEAIRVGRSFRVPEQAVTSYLRRSFEVAVRVYLQDGSDPGPIERSALDLLDAFGFIVERIDEPVFGSWFREFFVRAKNSSPPVEDQLAKLARGIELQGLDRPQSEVDLNQAEAIRRLLGALDRESDALIQVGSIMLVKVQNRIVVRNLTQVELAYFNQNPALFQDPGGALQILQRGWGERAQVR